MIGLAAIRPSEWDVPLFLHVFGALALIGALALAATFLFAAVRDGSGANLRLALRTLTMGVIPAYLFLRVGAEWIASKEGWTDVDPPPTWIDIGYIAADLGFLLIIISSLLGWFTLRRVRARAAEGGEGETRPSTAVRVAAVLIAITLAANLVALWAMSTKPV